MRDIMGVALLVVIIIVIRLRWYRVVGGVRHLGRRILGLLWWGLMLLWGVRGVGRGLLGGGRFPGGRLVVLGIDGGKMK